jgi:predicted N-acetyltransferase YhbS
MEATFRTEAPEDADAIDHILNRAFGPGRFAKVSERVREVARARADLSMVATHNARPIGVCRIFDVALGDTAVLFLGPLAVNPDVQALGVGLALTQHALTAALATPAGAIIVVGRPEFFARFGFVQIPIGRVVLPGPVEARKLQWLSLNGTRDDLAGRLSWPRAAN